MTKKLILGTAGHIDHGKSALVKALTGVDPDRLVEEKRRGITIELGFGELQIGDFTFGVVDVPGHERFVRMMVAGATGIDVVMLVVAADEGVMPQTREHLDICSLLGIQYGLVVLTKADLVDEDWLALVQDDVATTLEGSFLEDAPVVVVSARTGDGMDALREQLVRVAGQAEGKAMDGLARLPIDRVFEQRGFGPVVTGTLISGRLREGDPVALLPGGQKGRIRGLQNHGEAVSEASAGQRTAINIQGIDLAHIHRGQVLIGADSLDATDMFDAKIKLLPHLTKPLKHRAPLLLHTGTVQVPCRVFLHDRVPVEPGQFAYARLFPDEPTVLLPGDRFILRGFQRIEHHGTTFGGGIVIDPFPIKRRKDPALIERLILLEENPLEERIPILVKDAGPTGLTLAALCQRAGRTTKSLDKVMAKLLSQGVVVRFEKEPPRLIHQDLLEQLCTQASERLAHYHEQRPLEEGMSREALREQLRITSFRLFATVLERLEKAEAIVVEDDRVRLSGHRVRFAEQEEALRLKIIALYQEAGYTPPRARDLPELVGADERDIRTLMDLLLRQKELVRVRDDLYFASGRLDELQAQLIAYLDEHDTITAQDFKTLTDASRKFSIPLAEYFDQIKVTIRVGDIRKRLRLSSAS